MMSIWLILAMLVSIHHPVAGAALLLAGALVV